jgi:hypothetical protein
LDSGNCKKGIVRIVTAVEERSGIEECLYIQYKIKREKRVSI